MAASSIKFVVLDVGQGTGNFIEIYKAGALHATVLIDLGSESAKHDAGGPSVEYIVDTLRTMANPTIDYVFLSHSDSDHINLLEDVLNEFWPPSAGKPAKDTLTVNHAMYGGYYGKYKKGTRANVLETLDEYMPTRYAQSAGARSSSFSKGAKNKPTHTIEDVEFYLVSGNADTSVGTDFTGKVPKLDGFATNTMSLVVMVSFQGNQYVATGDATGVTLSDCNSRITSTISSTFFPFTMMVTAPHHGSERTTFNLTASTGNRSNPTSLKNVNDFIDNLKAKTLTTSAERVRRFRHPSAFLMNLFYPHFYPTPLYDDPTLTTEERHYYSAFFSPDDGLKVKQGSSQSGWPTAKQGAWWYTLQTQFNVFTNRYYDPFWLTEPVKRKTVVLPPSPGSIVDVAKATKTAPAPPLGVAWIFTTKANGRSSIARMTNRPASLALRRKIIADRVRLVGMPRDTRAIAPQPVAAAPLRTTPPPFAASAAPFVSSVSPALARLRRLV